MLALDLDAEVAAVQRRGWPVKAAVTKGEEERADAVAALDVVLEEMESMVAKTVMLMSFFPGGVANFDCF